MNDGAGPFVGTEARLLSMKKQFWCRFCSGIAKQPGLHGIGKKHASNSCEYE